MNVNKFIKEKVISNTKFEELASTWSDKGLVMLSGGFKYLSNAYLNLKFIRNFLKSPIPVEIWYLSEKEINKKLFKLIKNLGNIDFINIEDRKKNFPMKKSDFKIKINEKCIATTEGWRSKSYAMVHSKFKEIIYLDSDCFLFTNPDLIFNFEEYLKERAIFSCDIDIHHHITGRKVDDDFIVSKLGCFSNGKWDYSKSNPLWKIIEAEEDDLPEFESGFILLDKYFHYDSLFLSLFLNENSDITYKYIYGDKDTFHLAWAKNKARMHILKDVSRNNGHIVCKYKGSILFEHRVFDNKFDLRKKWNEKPNCNSFNFKEIFKEYFEEIKNIKFL